MKYVAIIIDSFRAAIASKVLWVACVAIWIMLAFIAPAGTRETLTTDFQPMELDNATRLKAMLADGLANDELQSSAVGRVASALPASMKTRLDRVAKGEDERVRFSELTDSLNHLLDNDDWYDETAWQSFTPGAEEEKLANLGSDANEIQQRRLRRLRLVASLPGVFGIRTATSVRPTYAGIDFPYDLPLDRRRLVTIINQLILPTMISWLLGFVFVFLGIVVTAPIIPGMLQPGSLHLLLSKPISRSGLLFAKFIGGCAFVLLCVAQLVLGLYLILGLRLDVWNVRLLWCIPASVLLFSVFYCVSVAAGLIFRSEVLSIGITCCFGAVCLVTGVIGGVFDAFVTGRDRINTIDCSGDTLMARSAAEGLSRFDATANAWVPLVDSTERDDLVFRPQLTTLPDREPAMLTAVSRGGRFNAYGFGAVDLLVFRGDDDANWDFDTGVRLPAAATQILLLGDREIAAVTTLGISTLSVDAAIAEPKTPDESSKADWVGKLSRMMGHSLDDFTPILPTEAPFAAPRQVAVRRGDADSMWVVSASTIYRLQRPGPYDPESDPSGAWRIAAETEIEGDPAVRITMSVAGNRILLRRVDGDALLLDSITLANVAAAPMPVSGTIQSIAAERNSFAIVMSNGSTWRISDAGMWTELPIDDASAVTVDTTTGDLVFAHDVDRISRIDAGTLAVKQTLVPTVSTWRLVDRYVISPLRFIVPQTGELGDVIASAISGKSEVLMGDPADDDTPVARYQWFRPLVSCSGFIAVMMICNALYFRSRDF